MWETYLKGGSKGHTRESRVKGIRTKISGHKKVPRSWQNFLRDPENIYIIRAVFLPLWRNHYLRLFSVMEFITSYQRVVIKGTNHSMAGSDYKKQTREFCFICRTLSGRVVSHVWFRPWILMWLSSWLGNSATYAVHAQQKTYRWVSCREEFIHLRSHQCHRRGSWGMKIHGLVHLPKF